MDQAITGLACPKCGGGMRAQERQGIVIDVCTTCRGIFLDRGELDRLLDLEASVASQYGQRDARRDDDRYDGRRGYDDDDDDDRSFGREGYGRGRRGGFLGGILDFD